MGPTVNRRDFLSAAGAASVATLALGAAPQKPPGDRRPVVISGSAKVAELAMARLKAGADPLDAAIEGVAIDEADPEDHSVGLGGTPNEEGVVELDAAVMQGRTHGAAGRGGAPEHHAPRRGRPGRSSSTPGTSCSSATTP